MRNITLSTIGYVPGIYRLAGEDLQLTLAVSLHAADDALRRKLVPGMTRYSLQEIVDSCRHYFRETKRRVTFEYCLLKNVNDGQADAARLAAMLQGLSCHVNVIPFNSFKGGGFHASEAARITAFCHVLEEANIAVTMREQRGEGIEAACGQLRRQAQADQGNLRIK
jgi:23S rRNA (adenine2503-C2)-methyltransferase